MSKLASLKAVKTRAELALLLGYQPKTLAFILFKKPDAQKYTKFTIPKRNGGEREIKAPYDSLKHLQKRLAKLLQACIDEINKSRGVADTLAHGFRPKFSIVTNAAVHRRRRFVFNADLADFFGSINFGRVRGYFIRNKNFLLDSDVATALAQIICHENSLPQGSPCSPVMSNLIGHILDIGLADLARKTGCTYSRYADDLTFSTNDREFPTKIAEPDAAAPSGWKAGSELVRLVDRSKFSINVAKTRMQVRQSRQDVTGLVVNAKVAIRAEYKRTARAMVNELRKSGAYKNKTTRSGNPGDDKAAATLTPLTGMLTFIHMVRMHNVNKWGVAEPGKEFLLDGTEKTFADFLFYRDFYAVSCPMLLCEGKTDSVYIRAAAHSLAAKIPQLMGEKKDDSRMKFRLFHYSDTTSRLLNLSGGTPPLTKFISEYAGKCRLIRAPGLSQPVVILVDSDKGAAPILSVIRTMTKATGPVDGTAPYYYLGQNLYVLPIPRLNGKDTMVEDYFDDAVTKTVLGGKKFSFSNRYDKATQYGKQLFAEHVIKKNQKAINFVRFLPLFGVFESIISAHASMVASKKIGT